MKPLSLYLHFPFCRRKCSYCDFNSHVPQEGEQEAYLVALRREIEARAPRARGHMVETVYLGGGTPTVYAVEQLAEVLNFLRLHFAFRKNGLEARPTGTEGERSLEITCEANPGTVDAAYLRALREAGVNRLSLGVQSFRDDELRLLGRVHSAEEASQAARAAREAGFGNLSLDLIAGLPGQTGVAWEESLRQALALAPEHLSCYGLSLPPGTPLAAAVERGELTPLDEDTSAALWVRTHGVLTGAAYDHYEVSNFARPGYPCRHNLTYWHNGEYLGFGVSAASYCEGCRSVNVAEVNEYTRRTAAGESVVAESECLPPSARLGETMMLALRLAEGADLAALRSTFGDVEMARLEPRAQEMQEAGLLEISDNRWRPTLRGMMLNNRLAGAFV